MVNAVGVESAEMTLLREVKFWLEKNVPPPDLSWGPRQCVWAIKSGKKVVMSPCKVLACVLTSLMVNAVGVESAEMTLLREVKFWL